MKFRVKDMDIAAGSQHIVILNHKDAKKLDLRSGDRILVRHGKRETTCILDISESRKAVPEGKIGLFEEVIDNLKIKHDCIVEVKLTGKPDSIAHIRDKLMGKELTYDQYYEIIDDISHDRLTQIEKTYFVSGCFTKGMSDQEIIHLTKTMVHTGKKLSFGNFTLDKHCLGGLPGNRTTMIIIPIVSAAGFTIVKTSSRAITSPAGTADTMECLANVELSEKKIIEAVKKTRACMVHGGSISLAPADAKIIEVEHPLSIDAEGQMLASIMAKKYSVGARHVLIDIPMGKNTKATNLEEADHLRKMFEMVGHALGMNVEVIVTDGSQPIGRGIGPLLEAEDVMKVLRNDPEAPQDLKNKSVKMAGVLLEMTGKYKRGAGEQEALKILESGAALKKMDQIILAQGRVKKPELGKYFHQIRSKFRGKVEEIDNLTIAKIARMAGAPDDKGAGLYLNKMVGDKAESGELLYTIFAPTRFKLELVREFAEANCGYKIRRNGG